MPTKFKTQKYVEVFKLSSNYPVITKNQVDEHKIRKYHINIHCHYLVQIKYLAEKFSIMELMAAYPQGQFVTLFVVNMLGVFIGSSLLKRVTLESFGKGLLVGFILALLNVTLGTILDFITTPLRWLTLGLFSFVVDAFVILLASKLVNGFTVKGFWAALGIAIVIAITNALFHWIF